MSVSESLPESGSVRKTKLHQIEAGAFGERSQRVGSHRHRSVAKEMDAQVYEQARDDYAVSIESGRNQSRSAPHNGTPSLVPKQVTFEYLMIEGAHQQKARLPMRVNIFPHDGTDSITTTVKNFYGLYDGNGVSFEDKQGCTLIARYENFQDKMTVYVRVIDGVDSTSATPRVSLSPSRPRLAPPIDMAPPGNHGPNISRPSSRAARNRSNSPLNNALRRSQSVSTNPKSRPKMSMKSRVNSIQDSHLGEGVDGYMSDSDEGSASVTSSRRAKNDVVASAEISVENIVEGGRRKRARFDSSELPLFQPSQVPVQASISSLSPQRRLGSQPVASPFQYGNAYTFTYNTAMASPQSLPQSENVHLSLGLPGMSGSGSYGANRRSRGAAQYNRFSHTMGTGILPTPDPTIGSVISDEDVARQLMALGDPSNFSYTGGRASTSTVDDAFSGKAEVASSAGGSDGSQVDELELPTGAVLSDYESEEEYEDRNDTSFKGESDGLVPEQAQRDPHQLATMDVLVGQGSEQKPPKSAKPRSNNTNKSKAKNPPTNKGLPISPSSLPPHSRKPSVSGIPSGIDDEDLSSKPRCQRCRKSKKGCDRQRPCGRCKDAGIGIEGCISEDEGNGRKGRYGRHMGVTVKKFDTHGILPPPPPPPPPHPAQQSHSHPHSPVHVHQHHLQHHVQQPLQYSPPQFQHYQQAFPQQYFVPGVMAAPGFFLDKNNKKRKR